MAMTNFHTDFSIAVLCKADALAQPISRRCGLTDEGGMLSQSVSLADAEAESLGTEVLYCLPMERKPKHEPETIAFYGEVRIYHPGYDRVLFIFPAYDAAPTVPPEPAVPPAPESAAKGGINHGLVLDACCVITNNQPGHLTTGTCRVPTATTILLTGDYYLHLTAGPTEYEIVTEFAAWNFPSSAFPTHWARPRTAQQQRFLTSRYGNVPPSAMSSRVEADDYMCIVSAFMQSLDNAYVLPKEESPWFNMQEMNLYSHNRYAHINDTANGMTLRSDIHRCFDSHGFVFYPCGPTDRRLADMPNRVSDKFLYARSTYTLIHLFSLTHSGRAMSIKFLSQYHIIPEATSAANAATGVTDVESHEYAEETRCRTVHLVPYNKEDKEYSESWHSFFPDYAEVDDPSDTSDIQIWTRPEDPRMERLAQAYKAQNPQIAMSSTGLPLHDASGGAFKFGD
ncbi:hypothetical protein OH76DRAFT_1483241 [Lentinus brumalis]|uniref:HNH nuclease domain-containing protein n=1 Tax=Lentinus brumalis TaxID=2498619 RepID=A0A371D9R4_9APHY|nr:hypothetical protein OH76DRAFT_1483241 [Polyporus brumalis]